MMQVSKTLQNLIENNRIAHAYLFEGAETSDKLSAAKFFAKSLLCVTSNSCSQCNGCLMFENHSHPDYHFLSVDGDTIKIREHIEPFFSDIRLSSPYSKRKVYIINEAHKMNTASQNSILKTLEEPHSNVIIILLTENGNALLPTVLSRVIRYNFNSDEADELSFDEDLKNIFHSIMKNLESFSASGKILASSELSSQKDNAKELFDIMQMYYRNSLVAKYTDNQELINGVKTDKISSSGAVSAVKIIDEARFALKSNANVQLTMDVLVEKLSSLYIRR